MSDTPETDAEDQPPYRVVIKRLDGTTTRYVPADLARKLERERNGLREANKKLNRRLTKAEGIIASSGIVGRRPQKCSGSLGRALANYAADKYKRALELIAEDCDSWLASECQDPSVEFIKLVSKYAREQSSELSKGLT